jgi:CubicO group peptidase (beta-lactamase class C family)
VKLQRPAPRVPWRKVGVVCAGVLVLGAIALQLTGHGYIWRALRFTYLDGHSTAHIDDARNFEQAPIANAPNVQAWPVASTLKPVSDDTAAYLKAQRSAAFVVAQRGQIISEQYFAPYDAKSRINIFSMAKTLTTLLTGAAVADGVLPSFDAPIATWLTEYANDPQGQQATLAQFSAMTSGHDWNENYYLPLNETTELYFGGHAEQTVLRRGFERAPGSAYEYSSASTQVLAVALSRALRAKAPQRTLADYLSQRLWQPLGMSDAASWSLDRPRSEGGMELAYCCVHANARDMARIGQLLLQRGQWQGQALVPADFVARMTAPGPQVRYYGYGLWMDPDHAPAFYFLQGHLGQYVIVVPERELVIVRLGQTRIKANTRHPRIYDEVYRYLDEGLRLAE